MATYKFKRKLYSTFLQRLSYRNKKLNRNLGYFWDGVNQRFDHLVTPKLHPGPGLNYRPRIADSISKREAVLEKQKSRNTIRRIKRRLLEPGHGQLKTIARLNYEKAKAATKDVVRKASSMSLGDAGKGLSNSFGNNPIATSVAFTPIPTVAGIGVEKALSGYKWYNRMKDQLTKPVMDVVGNMAKAAGDYTQNVIRYSV